MPKNSQIVKIAKIVHIFYWIALSFKFWFYFVDIEITKICSVEILLVISEKK